MPYLGRGLEKGNYLKLDDISSQFDGSKTTFNLTVGGSAHMPGSSYSLLVSLSGIVQEGEAAYTLDQNEITFAAAPQAADDCFIISLGTPLGIGVPSNGTVNGTQLAKPLNYDNFFHLDHTNDRVGIGTSIPIQSLDVYDGNIAIRDPATASQFLGFYHNRNVLKASIDKTGNNLTFENVDSGIIDYKIGGSSRVSIGSTGKIFFETDDNTYFYRPGADTLAFVTAGDERLRITSDGKIGFNENNPSKQFSYAYTQSANFSSSNAVYEFLLWNKANISSYSTSGASIQLRSGNTSAGGGNITGVRRGPANQGDLAFSTTDVNGNPVEKLRIDSSGNIGIGTSTPGTQLHLCTDANANVTLKIEPGTTAGNYSEIVLGRTSSAPHRQTTPVVKGGVPISGVPGILFGSENTNLPAIAFQTPNSSNGHIVFKPKGSERFRIDSGGRLFTGGDTQVLDSTVGSLHVSGGTIDHLMELRRKVTLFNPLSKGRFKQEDLDSEGRGLVFGFGEKNNESNKPLDGKVAVIAGSGRGIGRGIALELSKLGASIVVNDVGASLDGSGNDTGPAQSVVEEISELGGKAVASTSSVATVAGGQEIIDKAIDEFGRLDIVITPAGILRDRMIFNMTKEEWQDVIDVHLTGTFSVVAPASKIFREQKSGRIITFSSVSGLIGYSGQSNYGAAKDGIAGFTRVVAKELGKYGVTANAISPGANTRMTQSIPDSTRAMRGGSFKPAEEDHFIYDPEDVAPVVAWLCTDSAGHINGCLLYTSDAADE